MDGDGGVGAGVPSGPNGWVGLTVFGVIIASFVGFDVGGLVVIVGFDVPRKSYDGGLVGFNDLGV